VFDITGYLICNLKTVKIQSLLLEVTTDLQNSIRCVPIGVDHISDEVTTDFVLYFHWIEGQSIESLQSLIELSI
jgi:hypothetical protein